MRPYQYRIVRRAPVNMMGAAVSRTGSQEQLSTTVDGQPASDLEARFAKGLDVYRTAYAFRQRITGMAGQQKLTGAHANLAGELEIDFLVDAGQTVPVQIQGEIGHFYTPYQALNDEAKRELINAFGSQYGWHEVISVPFVELKDQESANNVVRRIIDGTYIARFAA